MGRRVDTERLWAVVEYKKDIDSGEISIGKVAQRLKTTTKTIYADLERINKEIY